MGNYIDQSVSVTGNADQLEKSWDALLADDHGGPLKLLKRETAFYQWRLAEKGGAFYFGRIRSLEIGPALRAPSGGIQVVLRSDVRVPLVGLYWCKDGPVHRPRRIAIGGRCLAGRAVVGSSVCEDNCRLEGDRKGNQCDHQRFARAAHASEAPHVVRRRRRGRKTRPPVRLNEKTMSNTTITDNDGKRRI